MQRQRSTLGIVGQLIGVFTVAPFLLSLLGLTLCVIGVFVQWGAGPGLIAAGVGVLVIEARVSGDSGGVVARPVDAFGADGRPL